MVDRDEIPRAMRISRKARTGPNTELAWWYIDDGSISVHATAINPSGGTYVVLTRKQLERALAVMDGA